MALVDREVAAVETPVDVLVRDSRQPARVVALPFYRREKLRA
jgi:glycine cleavage system aminomethyltransferase T